MGDCGLSAGAAACPRSRRPPGARRRRRRRADCGRGGAAARARMAGRQSARLPAAGNRPVLHPRLALSGSRTGRHDRHPGRCDDRLRHRRARLDPRLPAGARRPLDIGTGTGILAIAAAKRLRRRVWASDIDPAAAAVARGNAAKNGVAGLVRVRAAPGYRDRALRRRRYDLVLSNILARPLALLAPELARVLAPDGRAVLSGLLARQEALVLAAHRRCGLALERRYRIEGWSTLVLRRRSRTELARMCEPPILQGR